MTLTNQQIIDKYDNDWDYISIHQTLSESFIREFKDKVNWDCISIHQILSESFIRDFQNDIYWDYISIHQTLSESFIREFKDKVNWYCISKRQILSEPFIREFQDKVHWYCISKHQTHINYDHLVQSLSKPKKGSLISCKHKGHGIVLNTNNDEIEILFIESQQINTIIGKYEILNLKVIE